MDPAEETKPTTTITYDTKKHAELKTLAANPSAQKKCSDKDMHTHKNVYEQEIAEAKEAFEQLKLESTSTKEEMSTPPQPSLSLSLQHKEVKARVLKNEMDMTDLIEQLSLDKKDMDKTKLNREFSRCKNQGDYNRPLEDNEAP